MSSRRLALLPATLLVVACGGSGDAPDAGSSAASGGSVDGSAAAATTDEPTTTSTTTSTTTTSTATTTTEPALPSRTLSEPGPFPVGVRTLELPTGNPVEVWYPAAEGTVGEDTYDVRDFVPAAVRDLLTADIPASYTTPATRDAPPADPPSTGFPVVAVSHGFASIRLASSFLTSHLASWGMVVVAPDHPARDLASQLGGAVESPPDPADDLAASIDLAIAAAEPGGPLAGAVDAERIALVGHSAGGGTIVEVATVEDRVDGYVSMASGRLSDPTTPLPEVPSFYLAGDVDAVVSAADRTRPAFEAAPPPSRFWLIEGAGHNAFDDFCTFGNGTGIIGIAEASGLGGLLDAQPQFRLLGEDGCVPPARPVEDTFPVIRHGVTGWLLDLFGSADGESTDLGSEVGDLYDVTVEVETVVETS
jgi:dienelactone hydrolase